MDERDLTGPALAAKLEISQSSISRYCDPSGTEPKISDGVKIARYFDMTLDEFVGATPLSLRDTRPHAEAETRRADAAEAKLDRAKKHLRAALAELEEEASYRRASSKPLSAVQEAAKKAGGD